MSLIRRGLFRSESMTEALSVYLPATTLFRLLGLGRNILLTWLMRDQAEFGLFALALVVINLLNPLCSLGLNEAVTRYTPMYETRRMLRAFLARAIPLVCGVAAVGAVILMKTDHVLGPIVFQTVAMKPRPSLLSIGLMQNVVWATFTLIVYYLAISVLKGLRMFRALSLMELTHGVVFTAMAITTVLIGRRNAIAVVACYMMSLWIAMACFALPASLRLFLDEEQDEPLAGDPMIRRMFAFSLWAALAAIMWQGLQNYPLWYLNRIHGSDAAGVFGAMRTITQYIVVAAAAVATVTMTAVTKIWESEGREPADRLLTLTFKATSLILLTGCVVMALCRDEIALLFDPRYRRGAEVIPLLLAGFLIAGNLAFLAVHFTLIEKTRFLFWPWAIGVGCNVLFGLWLVRGLAAGRADTWAVRIGMAIGPAFNCGAGSDVGSAAWAGTLAMIGAMGVCLLLLRVEKRPVDGGSYLILAATCVLAFEWYVMVPAVIALWVVALTSDRVFSPQDKALLGEKIRAGVDVLRRRRGRPVD